MPLTGTRTPKKTSTPTAKKGRALLTEILNKLDTEWDTLKQDQPELHGDDAGLLAYYHACLRPALHWVGGDPYTWQPPTEYAQERLSKMCGWLTGLQNAEQPQIKQAREQMLSNLRACWPAYRDLATVPIPNDQSPLSLEVLPFTWEGIETLWEGQNWEGDGPAVFLPAFQCRESADFHLAALALLFLNVQLKCYLTDLKPHQTSDGRH